MKPTPVHRFYFSQDEAVAALFPSGIPSKAIEMRMEGDELVIDFIDPVVAGDTPAADGDAQGSAAQPADEDFPGDRPSPTEKTQQSPAGKVGQNELEARELCSQRLFQTFLEVRTEEAALNVLIKKLDVSHIREIDSNKYKAANFRDLIGDFQVWAAG